MKKINITPKAKKVILFSAMAVICIGIVALVSTVNAKSATEQVNPSSINLIVDDGSSELSISPIERSSSAASEAPAFVPSSGASQSAQLTVISKPTSTPPKPAVSSALTNKSSKPSYSSKPSVSSKVGTKKASSTSTNDGNNDPVFGNKRAPGGQMTTASDMYEDGVKVGIMD